MRTAIGTILTNKTVSSLSDVKQFGSALSHVTLVKEEVTVDIQVKKTHRTCFKIFKVVISEFLQLHARAKKQKFGLRESSKKIKERGQHPAS